jgi:TP53 regulating kinase-like protein
MELISKGAEAEIYLDKEKIVKKRVKKNYRLSELDLSLRKSRAKREAKILEKLPKEVCHPSLLKLDERNMDIEMSYIKGEKVRDVLDKNLAVCKEIGEKVGLMHNSGIVHGDLTTSNMMVSDEKVFLIDFGLSFFSDKIEDKAVDLHLFRQALESKHYKVAGDAFKNFIMGYKSKCKNADDIIERFEEVEMRGRNKAKY